MKTAASAFVAMLCACFLIACPAAEPTNSDESPAIAPPSDPGSASNVVPSTSVIAGTACRGRDDCMGDQVCMQNVCRSRRGSAAGEILTASARAQLDAGDAVGALNSYDEALERYRAANAAPPPELVCGAATAALRSAVSPELRESAAKRADTCFRHSLPGDPSRGEVRLGLARLRYDGLDLSLFDRPEPATRFFTQPPTRPTIDAITSSVDMTERDDPGYTVLATALREEGAKRAIATCFIADWETRHERHAEVSLTLKYSTRLHDRGSYDSYEPVVEVTMTTPVDNQFGSCLAENLTAALSPGPRVNHLVSWQETFNVVASVQ